MSLFNRVFVFLVVGFCSMSVSAITGSIYKKGSQKKVVLFTYKNDSQPKEQGVTEGKMEYFDPAGKSIVQEYALRNGSRIQRYTVDHQQTGRKGAIIVDGKNLRFEYEEKGNRKKDQTESVPENLVVGPTLVPYVAEHWKKLQGGESIDIRFGVWDRQETVGFTLTKIGTEKLDGRDVVLLRFKPTSFIIAAIVDPILFKFSPDGKDLIAMEGRVMPKQWLDNKWKDLDAEVVYQITK